MSLSKSTEQFWYDITVTHPDDASVTDILELVFRETNRVDGNEQISIRNIPACSTSVGHVLAIRNGNLMDHYVVEGCGFKLITSEQMEIFRHIPYCDRNLGFDFAMKQLAKA